MNNSDPINKIILFTKDKPALEGSGKSIRLMNWLAHLSRSYTKIYCIYFQDGLSQDLTAREDYPRQVEFIPVQLIRPNIWTALRRRLVPTHPDRYSLFWYMDIEQKDRELILKLTEQGPDILFFRLYLFPVLKLLLGLTSKRSKIALDIDDVESNTFRDVLRAQWRQRYFKDWFITRIGYHYMTHYEKSIRYVVNTLNYSKPFDQKTLSARYPGLDIQCFPNKVIHQSLPIDQIPKENKEVLFCGALNYFPNVDAVHFLIKEIWPIILKEIPSARLTIAGSHPSKQMIRWIDALDSISLIADPISMKEIFLKAALLIVPLRIGGGTRIKILQAFSYGVPVVTTSIGVSGIQAIHGKEVIIQDQTKDLARSAVEILHHVSTRRGLVLKAYELFEKSYSFTLP